MEETQPPPRQTPTPAEVGEPTPEQDVPVAVDPLAVAPAARDVEGPGGIAWGPALGRAFLRGLSLGVVVAVVLAVLIVVLYGLATSIGGEDVKFTELLMAMGGGALMGLFAGAAVIPLALVETVAATRETQRAHLVAAALTFPLALIVIAGLGLQVIYTVAVIDHADPARAADQTLTVAKELLSLDLAPLLFICAMLPAVPLTTYVRLRRFGHRQQLKVVVPLTAFLAFFFGLAGLVADRYIDFLPVLLLTAVSTILGALLPGAYLRGDQLERWVVKKFWGKD